jgi:hypothetical protein
MAVGVVAAAIYLFAALSVFFTFVTRTLRLGPLTRREPYLGRLTVEVVARFVRGFLDGRDDAGPSRRLRPCRHPRRLPCGVGRSRGLLGMATAPMIISSGPVRPVSKMSPAMRSGKWTVTLGPTIHSTRTEPDSREFLAFVTRTLSLVYDLDPNLIVGRILVKVMARFGWGFLEGEVVQALAFGFAFVGLVGLIIVDRFCGALLEMGAAPIRSCRSMITNSQSASVV